MIKVSIITVVYNGGQKLSRAIESVLNQTWPCIEYWVIDGKSTDESLAVAQKYQKQFEEKGYEYHIISEKDRGMYDALNKGVRLATGDIIGQINSDDWYEPDAAETAAKTFEEKQYDLFWADIRIINGQKSFVKKAVYRKYITSRDWNHPTTFIRAAVYKKNPYALYSMYDDFDLILRLRKAKVKCVVCNKVLANFGFGGMSNEKSMKNMFTRIGHKWHNCKVNHCGPLSYLEGAAIETAKMLWG